MKAEEIKKKKKDEIINEEDFEIEGMKDDEKTQNIAETINKELKAKDTVLNGFTSFKTFNSTVSERETMINIKKGAEEANLSNNIPFKQMNKDPSPPQNNTEGSSRNIPMKNSFEGSSRNIAMNNTFQGSSRNIPMKNTFQGSSRNIPMKNSFEGSSRNIPMRSKINEVQENTSTEPNTDHSRPISPNFGKKTGNSNKSIEKEVSKKTISSQKSCTRQNHTENYNNDY